MNTPKAKALMVRIEAKADKDEEVKKFLLSAHASITAEMSTVSWFALKFGSYQYGVFHTFADDAAREAHLNGPIAKTLMDSVGTLLTKQPEIMKLDVLAEKLPPGQETGAITKALILVFKPKEGHEAEVEQFLIDAQPMVSEEVGTRYWFALKVPTGEYAFFDVFPDNGARLKHLTGQVPAALLKHSLTILGSIPDTEMIEVLAHKE